MKNVQSFKEFLNESVLNENIRKQMPELLDKIKAAQAEFPKKNKRSQLQKLAKKTNGAEVFDQTTKFTYTPDGQVFIVYKYEDQNAVDNAVYGVEGKSHDIDKQKEKLVLSPAPYDVYAETSRPGYRVYADGTKHKINKDGRQRY